MKWIDKIDSRRIELIKEGYTYQVVATILTAEFGIKFTKYSVQERCKATGTTKKQLLLDQLDFTSCETDLKNEISIFPEESYQLDDSLTFVPEKQRQLKVIWEKFNDGKPKKILSLSDLHAPYTDFKAVEKAIIEHYDADILMLNGDIFDGHAMSDFDKLDDFDIEIEFEQVFTLLDVVSPMFKQIIWVSGNHEMSRFIRMVSRKFGNGMKKFVLKRLNPIQYICEKYDNIIIAPNHYVQVGSCVFTHPNGYSAALMSTGLKQAEIFENNKHDILPYPKVECVTMGHTHDLGAYYYNGIKVIEQGHLCFPPDYVIDDPRKRRWQKGYAVVHLNSDGSVDFNRTREYHL
ncbi:DNA repair exonuclease [Bacillus phage G]|uniref:Gp341 n=1 Tax=Bacillus phage G TaxID=2884420 RepID=G3MA82_9CAUD|nr:DNA repair exonuclease [Bacillus phage G]AEO93600.1 gp341 [Bacillus phage G]